jgi:hypothetical protein
MKNSMDKIVNWFILLLIFVFDPLAVALVIATNKMLSIERDELEENSHQNPLLTPLFKFIQQIYNLYYKYASVL